MPTQNNPSTSEKKAWLSVQDMVIFALLGTLMFCSKLLMEALPNVHLLGMFTVTFTVVFRKKALIPIYIYVFLNGLYAGFNLWWAPYLYIWTVLWAMTMLLPKTMPKRVACVVYPAVCGLHGFAFGVLYVPAQVIMFGMDFNQTVTWVLVGLPYDAVHGAANIAAGLLIVPLSELLLKICARASKL